ncbi:MAG: YicC family protein [Pirellulales bacterium]|nr:YicC family protein [Pirellulales bacterium]
MTGFGEARRQENQVNVTCEVRAINSRYFKITVKSAEGYAVLEPEIESVIRQRVRRGTIQVSLWIEHQRSVEDYRINEAVLEGYRRQLESLGTRWHLPETIGLDRLLLLPGVIVDAPAGFKDATDDWPVIRAALEEAMDKLARMRREEGKAMAADLRANAAAVLRELQAIEGRAPQVVDQYRERMLDRVNKLLAEFNVTLNPSDLIKEVGIYSERSDVSEEIVRLKSHLDQFETTLELDEGSGRKLEFLVQEMMRETNTIGSKSNDVEIARGVIEIKAAIEKIREMVQNVE